MKDTWVRAAMDSFIANNGILTLRNVQKEGTLNRTSFYRHFADISDLENEMIKYATERWRDYTEALGDVKDWYGVLRLMSGSKYNKDWRLYIAFKKQSDARFAALVNSTYGRIISKRHSLLWARTYGFDGIVEWLLTEVYKDFNSVFIVRSNQSDFKYETLKEISDGIVQKTKLIIQMGKY